ncbi:MULTISPECIES: GAF and ANTAR domain-containing protein [unclassified Curtobacterium]|uniref:GAF and ANTAR domain-containing protein n=1 Tax=unclassified Curtobacterium TaxID=257496 RepID=UPI0008DC9DF9|nr:MULTISPECIES: GAF and ANTAR domain-containing protein [unclassified Curtobacterium]OIH99554.1 transcriptional regulator [Curtobacterium sp. MCBA15_003]OII11459.1 transcriptional regulator [Curtobacterium sp. MCBA15_009]OII30611.1 transcriptional regulator [Curtobacterium sp. MMLR14_006]
MAPTREHRLVDTFVALTDTLVDDYDVVDLLQTLVDNVVDLFDASAAGILLVNQHQELEVLASTNERSGFVGLLQLDSGEGPCVECFSTGRLVSVEDQAEMRRRWPTFAAASAESGYASVHAIPMRLRDTTLGSLNLFREAEGRLNADDALAAQALTDVATISILQQRTVEHAKVAQDQLQRALDSRVVIEQAKGFVAYTHQVDMETAFRMLRQYARSHQERLADVARAVVERRLVIPA